MLELLRLKKRNMKGVRLGKAETVQVSPGGNRGHSRVELMFFSDTNF